MDGCSSPDPILTHRRDLFRAIGGVGLAALAATCLPAFASPAWADDDDDDDRARRRSPRRATRGRKRRRGGDRED